MWFVTGEMLQIVFIATLAYLFGVRISERLGFKKPFLNASVLISLFVLFSYSELLCAFYMAYTVITYIALVLIPKKTHRKAYFVTMCGLFVLPFFAYRFLNLGVDLASILLLVGFSYNMLKAVDALFFVYYTDMHIPFFNYANFLLFFPVFTSGPILRYRDFAREWDNLKPATLTDISEGVQRFIIGLFKKVVALELLNRIFNQLTALPEYHFWSSISILALGYLILYFDLSGYSDMAIGIGRMIAFKIPENFNKPWTAASFTQFWRKWHISLSDWIREHIFVVVQGKKLSKYQGALIGFCTMIIMSFWHEFSFMMILDGAYMGFFLVIENLFSLSTFNTRKEKKYKYIIRAAAVSFFFAINALGFSLEPVQIMAVLKGLIN